MNHKAFSLIEVSVVLLIATILLAGIAQSSKMIGDSKLASARSLTAGSPVRAIKDLVFWLDASAENVFLNDSNDSSLSNNDRIASWAENDSTKKDKITCAQTTQAFRPNYIKKGINDLPTVRFDVTNDDMKLSCTLPSYLNHTNTIFMVMKWTSSHAVNTNHFVIGQGSSGTILGEMSTGGALSISTWNGSIKANPVTFNMTSGQSFIMTRYSDTSNNSAILYKNGSNVSTAATPLSGVLPDTTLTIGNWPSGFARTLGGDIAEIIIFNRALANNEIEDIHKYLGKKWGIKLN